MTPFQVSADFEKVHQTSVVIMKALDGSSRSYGILGSLLTAGRLLDDTMTDPRVEIKFVQDAAEWLGAYFVPSGPGGMN